MQANLQPAGAERRSVPAILRNAMAEAADRVLRHPFLIRCADGTVTLDELRGFLVQHGKYSRYFTRYLCALMSQLEELRDVLHLAENLTDEFGYGGNGARRLPHSRIYADMLKEFEIEIDMHPIYPETQNLVNTMFMVCNQPRGTAGLGALCFGAEALVPPLYRRIIQGFRHHGVAAERLEFFSIHIECDEGHAEAMYDILARQSAAAQSARITALNAGEIAVNARLQFFDALLQRCSNARYRSPPHP